MNSAVTKFGTFDITLKLFVALDLAFSLTTTASLADHLTALPSKQHSLSQTTSAGDVTNWYTAILQELRHAALD